MNRRAVLVVGIIALLAPVLVGCSKATDYKKVLESNRAQPKGLPMSATGTAKAIKVSVPDVVTPGLARIDFGNNAQGEHALQLIRIDEGHTPQEALQLAGQWANKGKPLPDWIHPAGGTPVTEPRAKSTTTQNMELGEYFVIDTHLKGPPQIEATFKVVGEREDAPPNAKAQIQAYEYGFKTTGLERGRTEVLIKNTGKQPHEVAAARLKPGKTLADVKAYLKNQGGPSPVSNTDVESTSVIEGGTSQVTTLEFKAGNYALLCFVPDREGGPPHAFKGMVSQVAIR
jgi:hypothetical protein